MVTVKRSQLNPYFVTGFFDAESSFQISVTINQNSRLGWGLRAFFTIGLHSRDLALLLEIKEFFECGIIVKIDSKNEVSFRVNSLQDLKKKSFLILKNIHFWLLLILNYLNKL